MLAGPLDTGLYRFAHVIIPPIFKRLYRMDISGAEHIPRSGPVVLASNHLSNADPLFLGIACPRQIHFMAKVELFRFRPLGWLIRRLGSFPVRRGEVDHDAVRKALDVLAQGGVLGLFPEGHRQPEGRLGPPRPGAALLSLQQGVTTVPVGLQGTSRIIRAGVPRFPRITVAFGPPVNLTAAGLSRAELNREIGGRLMEAIAELLNGKPTETPV